VINCQVTLRGERFNIESRQTSLRIAVSQREWRSFSPQVRLPFSFLSNQQAPTLAAVSSSLPVLNLLSSISTEAMACLSLIFVLNLHRCLKEFDRRQRHCILA
jgi:hypothetical protein